ncbi:MAG: FAD-dependent monooxygenase [Planctomycetaceae bacterium]|nr:FAD-dependent monooxygenase [Planctomycetaceae bacterium]
MFLVREWTTTWDAVVVGAGPAGAVAAQRLAQCGKSVLLVDAKSFPRKKICGGCLNGRALQLLSECDLVSVLADADAVPLSKMRLACGLQTAHWDLAGGVVLNRSRFDAALVRRAEDSGVQFIDEATALVMPESRPIVRRIEVRCHGQVVSIDARMVLVADGLTRSSLKRLAEFESGVEPSSRIGIGTHFVDNSRDFAAGSLTMAVADAGYAGIVRTADGGTTIAAAVDTAALRSTSSPGELVARILDHCRLPVPEALHSAEWQGTAQLTRMNRQTASDRLLVLGDAIGYVEPFTGEGMAWAMSSALLAVPLSLDVIEGRDVDLSAAWKRILQQRVFREQWTCRLLTRLLRSPRLTSWSLAICRQIPWLPRRVIAQVNGRSRLGRTAIRGGASV